MEWSFCFVLNTPFKPKGNVDLSSLRTHILEALDAGVNGFLVSAMASEAYKLTLKEKKIYETDIVRLPSLLSDEIHKEIAEELILHIIEIEDQIKRIRSTVF